ncbi:hypothetical protein G9A89_016872 [Geosiphon pyriformis]|nr:hypothetical protein G9A89_016872 [Geosiphon pyriformis]
MSKKSRSEIVGHAYERLAAANEWKNRDGSIFPVSAKNLANYIRLKANTNKISSIEWWLYCLGKYQKEAHGLRTSWELARDDPKVQYELRKIKHNNSDEDVFESLNKKENVDPNSLRLAETEKRLLKNNRKPHTIFAGEKLNSTQKSKLLKPRGKISLQVQGSSKPISKNEETLNLKKSTISRKTTQSIIKPEKQSITQASKQNDPINPEKTVDFKSKYEAILEALKDEYVNTCKYHPRGCFEFEDEGHLSLNEIMLRRWAYCIVCAV